eukprot:PhF_6_TR37861/c1_g2_i2/m.56418
MSFESQRAVLYTLPSMMHTFTPSLPVCVLLPDVHFQTVRVGKKRVIGKKLPSLSSSSWLIAGGWRLSWFPSPGPTCSDLDDVVPPSIPAYLRDRDGHTVWLNRAAYQQYCDTVGTARLEGFRAKGWILRDGLLVEEAGDCAAQFLPKLE